MSRSNSASRVLEILKQAEAFNSTATSFQVWAEVFEIDVKNQNKAYMEISQCLNLLHNEIEIIKIELDLPSNDEFKCNQIFNHINDIFAVHSLMNQWDSNKKRINREVLVCFGYCREALPDEESIIIDADISEIIENIESLETLLIDSSLPISIKRIISAHLDKIRIALNNYKIVGVSAIQESIKSVVGEVVANDVAFTESKDTPEVTKLGELLKKLHKVADGAVKTEKYLATGSKLLQHGSKALEVINSIV